MAGNTGERPFVDIITSVRYWVIQRPDHSRLVFGRLAFCEHGPSL
jgi:cytochrome b559 alpha subunit